MSHIVQIGLDRIKSYQALKQAQGSMNLARCPSPEMYERGNYVKILQGYAKRMA